MKKQLLSIIAALAVGTVVAQTPSPSWSISQNAAFSNGSIGIKFMDAVDNNVLWVMGYDGTQGNTRRNYNWFSRTINGGSTFTSGVIYSSTTTPLIGDTNTYVVANMEGVDANTAWVSAFKTKTANTANPNTQGSGAIHRTVNGGANWVNMTAAGMFTNASSFCDFVSFFTPSVGIVVGDPVNGEYEIWRTTNGGLSWNLLPAANIPNPSSSTEYAITNLYYKQGTSNLWFGTNEGRIFYSNNSGLSFSVSAPLGSASSTVTEIAFSTANDGVAYVYDSGAQFQLWHTSDGGVTWSQISPVDTDLGLNDVVGIPGTGYLVSVGAGTGNQIISYSSDNGVTWTDYGSTQIQYLTADFGSNTTGWAGSFSDPTNPAIGGIWKYSGAAITGTTSPTAGFTIPSDICLSGPSVTVAPVDASTGNPAITYSWTSSPSAGISAPTASNPVITFNTAGTYTISLTVTNGVGTNSTSQVINVLACSLPTVSFSTSTPTACANIKFNTNNTSTGGIPAPSYSWSASSPVTFSPSAIAISPTIIANTPGTLTISLVATNSQGTVGASQVVTVQACSPDINFTLPTPLYFCSSDYTFATFTTSNTTQVVPGVGANTYTWSVAPSSGVAITNQFIINTSIKITNATIATYTVTLKAKNASGTSTVSQTMGVDFCTGINEQNSLAANMLVYPNPAHDQLFVSLPAGTGAYKVEVINLLGSVIYSEKVAKDGSGTVELNLAGKPKGVYFLTVEANNQKATRKIIIE
jgi:hypothetical protein